MPPVDPGCSSNPGHPAIWNATASNWCLAQEFRAGDRFSTNAGLADTLTIVDIDIIVPVHNIEVEVDHCYRVGQQGLLVHNASPSYMPTTPVTVERYNDTIQRPEGASLLVTNATLRIGSEFNRGGHFASVVGAITTAFRQNGDGQWQRGHLIGNLLGGPGGSEWRNMVPLHRRANDPGMQECETRIKERVDAGEDVMLTVTPTYGDRKIIPLFVKKQAVSNCSGDQNFEVNVPNQIMANAPKQCLSK